MGTVYPYPWVREPLEHILNTPGLNEEEREALLGGRASYDDIALPASERDRTRWFDTDNFERSSARQPDSFHRRVFPNRIDVRADDMNQLDLCLQRQFVLAGRTRFQARLDAINALNRVQWDRPNTDPTSSNFGVVTQQWNTPRWLQLQGRITF
jgi:hypothetical protein